MDGPERLAGKVAIVTGGSKGIGWATARALATAGAAVTVAARDADATVTTASRLGGNALGVPTDVTDPEACEALVARVLDRFGRLDLCVCSAGVGHWGYVHELDPAAWRATMAVNVDGTFHTVRAVLPPMLAQEAGHIITLASIYGHKGAAGFSAYCASKYAILGFSEALSLEVKPRGIKVTAVSPGTVDTGFRDHMTNRPRTGLLTQPERMLTADDVADAICWAATTSPTAVPDEIRLETARWW